MGGYGYEPEFDGEAFCREGVILVTINYRLGILGFLIIQTFLEKVHIMFLETTDI